MKNWIEQYLNEDTDLSSVQAWVQTENGFKPYFTLFTTREIDEFEIDENGEPFYIVSASGTTDGLSEIVPNDETSRTEPALVEISSLGYFDNEATFEGDIRIERMFSGQDGISGIEGSRLKTEIWVEEDNVPEVQSSIASDIHDILKDRININLDRHPDYRGNLLIVLEDHRVDFKDEETPHLELEPELVDTSGLEFVIDWEEYGDLIWSESITFDEVDNTDSTLTEGAIKLQVDYGGEEYNVDFQAGSKVENILP